MSMEVGLVGRSPVLDSCGQQWFSGLTLGSTLPRSITRLEGEGL